MNPGQDVILAVRAIAPSLPWKLGDSVRPLEPSVAPGAQFTDANGLMVTNTMQDYGWEYVWHCHLLGHEENDMMRPHGLPGRSGGAERADGHVRLTGGAGLDGQRHDAGSDHVPSRAGDRCVVHCERDRLQRQQRVRDGLLGHLGRQRYDLLLPRQGRERRGLLNVDHGLVAGGRAVR